MNASCRILATLAACVPAPLVQQESPAPAPGFVLLAEWDPISDSHYSLHESHDAVSALREPTIAQPRKSWPVGSVDFALPPLGAKPGEPFELDPLDFMPFLRQIHPGAAPRMRHMIQVPGARGVVLSESDERLDLLLRVHAGFELSPTGWLAPAQFEGRLVLDPRSGAVGHFSLALPATRPNMDVNVEVGLNQVIADIGSVPRMRVTTEAAAPAIDEGSLARARLALSRSLYAFAQLDWIPFPEALARAAAEDKPLHVVVLFGALGDESC